MTPITTARAIQIAQQHHQTGRLAEAEKIYRQILAQQPNHAQALNLLGVLAGQVGRLDAANELIRRAIQIDPNFAEAHGSLGVILEAKGNFDDAIESHRQAIRLKPDIAEMHSILARALKSAGRLDEAVAAYREAIRLEQNDGIAHANLGGVQNLMGRFDDALASLRQAVRLRPDLARAYNNLGSTLRETGRLDEAIESYRQAIRLKPDYAAAHSNLIYTLHFLPRCDDSLIHEELRRWNEQRAQPLRKLIGPHANNRDPNRRLRIGYVSADFYDHASAFFLVPLFRHHDREQFELYCYAEAPQSRVVPQQMRDEVRHWRFTEGLTDEGAARLIREDQIDILVDLKLHTSGNRLLVFAQKPAPVQATWLGYPGTAGLEIIDYRITDPYLDPSGVDDDKNWERPIRLPETFWCYDPLATEPAVNAPPCLETGFVTFGCLNSFNKINEQVLQLWALVLKSVDRSRLIILCPAGSHRQALLDLMQREGIEPDRIELIVRRPRPQYLKLYHRIDVGLDTFPYNGHTTSLDSFWMGVPVLTLVGKTSVGRGGMSQLTNLGLPELIAHTPEQYVRIAADLANDMPRVAELRRTLRARMQASPLMDAPRFARNIEAAYREMWRKWCAAGGAA
jgi:protein O-GlcNAc transferase